MSVFTLLVLHLQPAYSVFVHPLQIPVVRHVRTAPHEEAEWMCSRSAAKRSDVRGIFCEKANDVSDS